MPRKVYDININLNTHVEEAYKVLRTNIQFYGIDQKIKTVTVTSSNPGEGKTTTSINLAASFAQTGMKVLYVDADLRKPMMMKELGNDEFKGLSNYLTGHAPLDEIISPTSIKGFFFVACGLKPLNAAEIVASEAFDKFLTSVKEKYDMIIIDTPPLGSVIDAALIAAKTDGVLLVVEQNKTKIHSAKMVKAQLEKANVRILGVVLNKIPEANYRDYYSSYDYYGSEKKYVKGWKKVRESIKKV